MAMTVDGKNRIMIFGPKTDGTYVVEFRTAKDETLGISIPGDQRHNRRRCLRVRYHVWHSDRQDSGERQ
jgi:hypothetical protein